MLSGRPRHEFWIVVSRACALAALGSHTPFYPALQALVPPLRTFRFPVKYLSAHVVRRRDAGGHGVAVAARRRRAAERATRRLVVVGGAVVVLLYVGLAWVLVAPTLPIQGRFAWPCGHG